MEKNILVFILIVLFLGVLYLYGIVLDIKKNQTNNINSSENKNKKNKSLMINNNSKTIFSTPKIVKPTFQFSTDFDNKENEFKITNVNIYDDLLLNDEKYYFDKELFLTFDYSLPENEYFYFTFIIDVNQDIKHKIKFSDNITLVKGEGNMNKNPLGFVIPSIEGNKTNLVISRIRILINNMKNEIVYNTIIPVDILLQHKTVEAFNGKY